MDNTKDYFNNILKICNEVVYVTDEYRQGANNPELLNFLDSIQEQSYTLISSVVRALKRDKISTTFKNDVESKAIKLSENIDKALLIPKMVQY